MTVPTTLLKGQGTLNDFVVYADPDRRLDPAPDEVRRLCDRRAGIGGDGLLRLVPTTAIAPSLTPEQAASVTGTEWFMDYRNADGSIAEMCGNGVRVVTALAERQGIADLTAYPWEIGTRAGVKRIVRDADHSRPGTPWYRVQMGQWSSGDPDGYRVGVDSDDADAPRTLPGTYVDLGNPHVVVLLSQAQAGLLPRLSLRAVPPVQPVPEAGANVEFVSITDSGEAAQAAGGLTMRVHERDVGETMSCGTGACAAAARAFATTGTSRWNVRVPGGLLEVTVTPEGIELAGPARLEFEARLLHRG